MSAPATLRVDPREGTGKPGWQAALDALGPRLAGAAKESARVRFVVSDHFARYLVLPWDPGLSTEAERTAYLRHGFDSVYGPRTAQWVFDFDRDGGDALRVAVAIDAPLVAALREAAARARLRVRSIVPLAVAIFNQWHRPRGAGPYFFAVREPGRLTALFVEGGAVRRVASRRCGDDSRRELAALLATEAIDAGVEHDPGAQVYPACWEGARPLVGAPLALGTFLAQPELAAAAA